MPKIFNNRKQKLVRQKLRQESPLAERLLWPHLRNGKMGVKFRRQVSIGAYVVDFYCPALKLAIEVDGASHAGADAQQYDAQRQSEIEALGVRFVRVANEDLYRDAPQIVRAIYALATELTPTDNHA